MGGFLARRGLRMASVVLAMGILAAALLDLAPGDPLDSVLGPRRADPELAAQARAELGLDRAAPARWAAWTADAARGDLGRSYASDRSVTALLGERLPVTALLVLYAQALALALAVPLALSAAWRRGGWVDRAVSTASLAALALPGFVLGVVLLGTVAVRSSAFPTIYRDGPFLVQLQSLFLPALALGLGAAAVYARILREDVTATLEEDWIAYARGKGLAPRTILWRHALRPSVSGTIAAAGVQTGVLLTGALVVEEIFAVPGIGGLLFRAVSQGDLPVVQGVVLVVAVASVAIHFAVDVVHAGLDPRVRRA